MQELDYVNEGQNQTLFAESIREDLPQVPSETRSARNMRLRGCTPQV